MLDVLCDDKESTLNWRCRSEGDSKGADKGAGVSKLTGTSKRGGRRPDTDEGEWPTLPKWPP